MPAAEAMLQILDEDTCRDLQELCRLVRRRSDIARGLVACRSANAPPRTTPDNPPTNRILGDRNPPEDYKPEDP